MAEKVLSFSYQVFGMSCIRFSKISSRACLWNLLPAPGIWWTMFCLTERERITLEAKGSISWRVVVSIWTSCRSAVPLLDFCICFHLLNKQGSVLPGVVRVLVRLCEWKGEKRGKMQFNGQVISPCVTGISKSMTSAVISLSTRWTTQVQSSAWPWR